MKKILIVVAVSTILGCGSQKKVNQVETNVTETKNVAKNNVSDIGNTVRILEKNVKASLEFLASDELEGRNTGSKGIEKAAVFIENNFKKNNIKPYFKTYRDSFNLKDIVGYNLVGYIEGNDSELKNEFVILGFLIQSFIAFYSSLKLS